MTARTPVAVLGAGPAGLAAALQLARRQTFDVTVLERSSGVGGNAGSFELEGLRVDYGSHRLHPTCPPQVLADLRTMLGEDLLERPRHGRIRLRNRWVHFPLKPLDLMRNLPGSFALGVLGDMLRVRARSPGHGAESFGEVLERGLGRTICRDFYFPYAEKIWGVPPHALDAEQARRRVSASSPARMIRKTLESVPGVGRRRGGRFFYPRRGFGQISESLFDAARDAGVAFRFDTTLSTIETVNGTAVAVQADGHDRPMQLPTVLVLSTIPLPSLVRAVTPLPPAAVRSATEALTYRSMILIYLVLDSDGFSEYDAHYFPGADIPVTRVSEPKNYGLAQCPGTTVLCAELPCSTDGSSWNASDAELGALVLDSLARAQLPVTATVRRVVSRRLSHAYPIYTRDYRTSFECVDAWIDRIEGVLTFGRQGLFAHDNTHHTLAMAYAAAECIDGAGRVDRARWNQHRSTFESHVVED